MEYIPKHAVVFMKWSFRYFTYRSQKACTSIVTISNQKDFVFNFRRSFNRILLVKILQKIIRFNVLLQNSIQIFSCINVSIVSKMFYTIIHWSTMDFTFHLIGVIARKLLDKIGVDKVFHK